MTQKEEQKILNELKDLNIAFSELHRLEEENEKWFNSEENKEEYENELKMRESEYRNSQI